MLPEIERWLHFPAATPTTSGAKSAIRAFGTFGTDPAGHLPADNVPVAQAPAVLTLPRPADRASHAHVPPAPATLAPEARPEEHSAPICLTCRKQPTTAGAGGRCPVCVERARALAAAWQPGDPPIILGGDDADEAPIGSFARAYVAYAAGNSTAEADTAPDVAPDTTDQYEQCPAPAMAPTVTVATWEDAQRRRHAEAGARITAARAARRQPRRPAP